MRYHQAADGAAQTSVKQLPSHSHSVEHSNVANEPCGSSILLEASALKSGHCEGA